MKILVGRISAGIFSALSIVAAIVQTDSIMKEIKVKYPSEEYPNFDWYVLGFLIIMIVINYFVFMFAPLRKLKRMKQKQLELLNKIAEDTLHEFRKRYKIELSVNIMLVKRKLYSKYEPNKKAVFFGKVFVKEWGYGNNHSFNTGLKFNVNQGICGLAFKENQKPVHRFLHTMTQEQIMKLCKFSEEQYDMTKHVKFIAAGAIKLNSSKNGVIAVTNIECHDENGLRKLDSRAIETLYVSIKSISNTYMVYHLN
jgi:hypothetical protein